MSALQAVLDRIRERRNAATPGPWHGSCGSINTNDGSLVANLPPSVKWRNTDADGRFIAHSWEDIGTLLAIVEGLDTIDDAVKEATA